ncbi:MAG TPA: DUF72 domain-containing protein [Gammaproteobacteria bacterium]
MRLYCGTSGFSFKEWKGPFYPAGLKADEMLSYYASRLSAVEINNTFYRLPSRALLERWRDQVPEDFRFAVKTSRRITHVKRLEDCADEAERFFDAVDALGERLGCVLVQLPPHFRIDVERLARFLELVPERVPAAFEFRHDSWRDPAVHDVLASRGAAWVTVDDEDAEPGSLPRTASFTYLRLRAPGYAPPSLERWLDACSGFERAFVFFKHEDEAAGPKLAEQMQRMQASDRER